MNKTTLILTFTILGWAMAVLFYIAYYNKPTQVIKQVSGITENYDIKDFFKAGNLCNSLGGVLTSYDINEYSYSKEISVNLRCEFKKDSL